MPSAAAPVIPRSSGSLQIMRIPAAATPSSVLPGARGPRASSRRGIRRISTSASSASTASTMSDHCAPKAAASVPASAGPITSAVLKDVVSSALAGVRSSSGTIVGIRLVKPPNESG